MYYKLQTFDLGFLKILNCGGVDVKKKDETKIFLQFVNKMISSVTQKYVMQSSNNWVITIKIHNKQNYRLLQYNSNS